MQGTLDYSSFKVKPKYQRIKNFAEKLKLSKTPSEKYLYAGLKRPLKETHGIKIKREYLIYPYICDFLITKYGIVIEVDGGCHNNRVEYDAQRDSFLTTFGLEVLRFNNETIDNNREAVVESIYNAIEVISKRGRFREFQAFRRILAHNAKVCGFKRFKRDQRKALALMQQN